MILEITVSGNGVLRDGSSFGVTVLGLASRRGQHLGFHEGGRNIIMSGDMILLY